MIADLALSWRMGWTHAVPLLGTQIHSPLLRLGPDRRRARPGGDEFERAIFIAAALGAAEGCRLGYQGGFSIYPPAKNAFPPET